MTCVCASHRTERPSFLLLGVKGLRWYLYQRSYPPGTTDSKTPWHLRIPQTCTCDENAASRQHHYCALVHVQWCCPKMQSARVSNLPDAFFIISVKDAGVHCTSYEAVSPKRFHSPWMQVERYGKAIPSFNPRPSLERCRCTACRSASVSKIATSAHSICRLSHGFQHSHVGLLC